MLVVSNPHLDADRDRLGGNNTSGADDPVASWSGSRLASSRGDRRDARSAGYYVRPVTGVQVRVRPARRGAPGLLIWPGAFFEYRCQRRHIEKVLYPRVHVNQPQIAAGGLCGNVRRKDTAQACAVNEIDLA